MINAYEKLFNAIWINAIEDETQSAARELYCYAFDSAYETYSLNVVNPLKKKDKKLKDIKTVIRRRSQRMAQKLIPRIRELVYEESKQWPNNKNLISTDPEYNSILKKLKQDILKFAENEFMKFKNAKK